MGRQPSQHWQPPVAPAADTKKAVILIDRVKLPRKEPGLPAGRVRVPSKPSRSPGGRGAYGAALPETVPAPRSSRRRGGQGVVLGGAPGAPGASGRVGLISGRGKLGGSGRGHEHEGRIGVALQKCQGWTSGEGCSGAAPPPLSSAACLARPRPASARLRY